MDQIDQNADRMIRNDPPPLPSDPASDALGYDPDKMKGVTDKLAAVKDKEIAADAGVANSLSELSKTMMPRLEEMSRTAGIEAKQLKPWNEEAESAKRQTDPIAAFGSLGSVFGILASAFTHAPMENALNASAAAINAIKDGNAKDYERAYKAWEANTKLALERHTIEHQSFQDALELTKTNMAMGLDQMRVNAIRFGNEKDKVLLEAGMSKEVIEYHESMDKLKTQIKEGTLKRAEAHAEVSHLFSLGYDPKNPTSEKSQQAWKQFQKEKAEQKRAEHTWGGASADKNAIIAGWASELQATDSTLTTADALNQATTRYEKEHPKGSGRVAKPEEEAVRARASELLEQNPTMSKATAIEQAQKEYKLHTAAPTGNRMDELQGKIDRVNHAEHIVDQIDGLLLKHKAITGIGGMLTRPAEIVGNLLGSNETDREEFKRYIETMRLEAPRILLDTQGRPISAEADRVNTIIAGLSPGDTGPNTIRAYIEFRKQLKEIKADLEKRRGGKSTESAPPAATTRTRPAWMDAPLANP